jgi:hypothetical protein
MNAACPTAEEREYGNTTRELRRITIVGLAIGVFAATAGAIGAYYERRLDAGTVWIAFGLLVTPVVVMVIAVLPTLLFHIRLCAARVQHVFLRRYILSDYPVSDFIQIRYNHHGCAAVLYFRGGQKIHFFGAHLGEITRLSSDLSEATHEDTQRT